MKKILLFASVIFLSMGSAVKNSSAQLEILMHGYEDKYLDSSEGAGAESNKKMLQGKAASYIYETPTMQALSYLYWGLGVYKPEDNQALDIFMMFNECEMFKAYNSDEFEWEKIRNATKNFIMENKKDFPTRFEFVIPIKLGDYNKRKNAFSVQEEFEIISIRRFEFLANNYSDPSCVRTFRTSSQSSYPTVLILEFSRPVTITDIHVKEEVATAFLERRLKQVQQLYNVDFIPKARLLSKRDVIIVLKVKIFTHGKLIALGSRYKPELQIMGVLEGYEVYEDNNREHLLYRQNYITSKDKGKLYSGLTEQYQILREKSQGEGIMH